MKKKEFLAIIQYCYTIFGVGKTKIGALRDANQYLSEKMTLKELHENNPAERIVGEMYLVRCTEDLYNAVKKHGGDVKCELSENRVLDVLHYE